MTTIVQFRNVAYSIDGRLLLEEVSRTPGNTNLPGAKILALSSRSD
jgi:hypothetical protein